MYTGTLEKLILLLKREIARKILMDGFGNLGARGRGGVEMVCGYADFTKKIVQITKLGLLIFVLCNLQ